MPIRLIEVYVPEESVSQLRDLLDEEETAGVWTHPVEPDGSLLRILIAAEESERILDALQGRLGDEGRILLLHIEATIPRLERPEEEDEEEEGPPAEGEEEREEARTPRISREELYTKALEMTEPGAVYITTVALSTLVAAIGMLQDSVAVVIGAMVIAPLLGPNMALSLATTLGDLDLARTSIRSNGLGILLGLGLSVVLGIALTVDPGVGEIASRTEIGLGNITLALASGSAGALAFTTGVAAALVGVMVAVALLPPLVAVGLLLGAGEFGLAGTAALLLGANIICVNLAGVLTFLVQGIRPRTWWETEQARKATRLAVALWTVLLALLVVAILLSRGVLPP